jgi:hypothetical protein
VVHTNSFISESSFYKYFPKKQFRATKRRTDLCDICHELKSIITKLRTTDTEELKEKKKVIDDHKDLAKSRRDQFNADKVTLEEGEMLLVLDFKENIRLKKSPEELGKDFYTRPMRAIFCIVVWTVKNKVLIR